MKASQDECYYGGFTTIYDYLFGTIYSGYSKMDDVLHERITCKVPKTNEKTAATRTNTSRRYPKRIKEVGKRV